MTSIRSKNRKNGFTMIELMIVVVIVGVLAAIAVPIYGNYIKNSRVTEATSRIGEIVTAAKAYAQENQDGDGNPTWPPAAGGGVVGPLPDTTGDNFDIAVLSGGVGLDATANSLTITANGKNKMAGVTVAVTVPDIFSNGNAPVVTGL
jgi:prepilin-type N-terminal cleavage/methylation domain-containing protein